MYKIINGGDRIIILNTQDFSYRDETFLHNAEFTNVGGTMLRITAPNDPNATVKDFLYSDIDLPSSTNLTDLIAILYAWKYEYTKSILFLPQTNAVSPNSTVLQNIGGTLYFGGSPVAGAGGIVEVSSSRFNNTVNQSGLTAGQYLSWNTFVDDLGTSNTRINGGDPTIIELDAGWFYIVSFGITANFTAAGGQITIDSFVQPNVGGGITATGKQLRLRGMNSATAANIVSSSVCYQDCTSVARTFQLVVSSVANLNFISGGYPDYPYLNIMGFKTI